MADDNADQIPKSGGNGPFIGAAVLMLLLMGGLILWKMSSGNPPTPTETPPLPAPVASAAPAPVFDDPPPPPPPPSTVAEDAGKPDDKQVGARRAASASGCGGGCQGDATPALQAALRAKAGQARGCYERALRQNAMLQGRLRLQIRVGTAGQVCSANVVSNELADQGVASCVMQMFKSTSFPMPEKGCVDTQVPLNFTPKQ